MPDKLKKELRRNELKNGIILLWVIFVYLNYYFRFFDVFFKQEAAEFNNLINRLKAIIGG